MKERNPGKLSKGIPNQILYDNATHHSEFFTSDVVENSLNGSPYSPDASPCDFHVLGQMMKAALATERFGSGGINLFI